MNKKDQETAVWGVASILVIVGGAAHIIPDQVAGITSITLGADFLTVQLLAGIATVLIGLGMLAKLNK